MKGHVWKSPEDKLVIFAEGNRTLPKDCAGYIYVGYVELEVERPKKIATKEARDIFLFPIYADRENKVESRVPLAAKNVRVLYDIEE